MMATISKIFHCLCIFIYVSFINCETTEPNILGIRLEKTDGKISYNEEGIITIEAGISSFPCYSNKSNIEKIQS